MTWNFMVKLLPVDTLPERHLDDTFNKIAKK
jgi:hypothetical protein